MSGLNPATTRSHDELADAIRDLSDPDWVRLHRVAVAYSRGRPIEPDDLLQEAFLRALDGSRNCPAQVDVVKFLAEAMRSIAHATSEGAKGKPQPVPVANHGDPEQVMDLPDPNPDAEQVMENDQETSSIKTAMLSLFEDDAIAQIILEGVMEGMEGEDLRKLTELDLINYQSKRKLIRRRIDKRYPEGWAS